MWLKTLSSRGICALFLLLGVAFYARSWNSYFVCDDYEFLGRINFHNVGQYLGQSWAYGNEYRPLLPYSYALDALLSGKNPLGYHVTNTLLHIGSSCLLVAIAGAIGITRPASVLSGVLYLINPVCHEALLWISGRPVVLSTLLQFLSIWFLLAPNKWLRPWRMAASLVCFVLALLTYEGAIALPFVLLALFGASAAVRREYTWRHLTAFFAILAVYLSFWAWIFHFHLVRQRQDSISDAAHSFVQAILHSWHGAYRLEVGLPYVAVLSWFLLARKNRAVAFWAFIAFVAAYTPFFVAKGFAPRFAYFASSAACVLFASALIYLVETRRRLGYLFLAAVFIFYAIGMQNLINQWRDAGEIARNVTAELTRAEPRLPAGAVIAISDVPLMYKHAYVYLTGLQRAVSLAYGKPIIVRQSQEPVCSIPGEYHFRYSGEIAQEVRCPSR